MSREDDYLEDFFASNDDFVSHSSASKEEIERNFSIILEFTNASSMKILNWGSGVKNKYFSDLKGAISFMQEQIKLEIKQGLTGLDPERLSLRLVLGKLRDINSVMLRNQAVASGRGLVSDMIEIIEEINDDLKAKPRTFGG